MHIGRSTTMGSHAPYAAAHATCRTRPFVCAHTDTRTPPNVTRACCPSMVYNPARPSSLSFLTHSQFVFFLSSSSSSHTHMFIITLHCTVLSNQTELHRIPCPAVETAGPPSVYVCPMTVKKHAKKPCWNWYFKWLQAPLFMNLRKEWIEILVIVKVYLVCQFIGRKFENTDKFFADS